MTSAETGPRVEPVSTRPIIKKLPDGQTLNIRVVGETTLLPPRQTLRPAKPEKQIYDAIVVGAGLSGLSAAWRLRNKNILVLEREATPGGLAAQGQTANGRVTYARGAAYITEPDGEVAEVYEDMGLTSIKKTAIPSPIDSYFYEGRLIKDIWEEPALLVLPPGFRAFKEKLQQLAKENYLDFDLPEEIPEKSKYLDHMTVAGFLKPYGPEVTEFLDSYCQSALGGHATQVSALAFLQFYKDEIETRYTWPGGTGGASHHIVKKLLERNPRMFRTNSLVHEVLNTPDGVTVTYERDGQLYTVKARSAVMAVPLKASSKIVPEMPEDQKQLIAGIEYADYVLHEVFTPRDLFKETYDTWSTGRSFTDVIAGRWVETHGFKKKTGGPGILTVYMPLAPPDAADILAPEQVAELAQKAAVELRDIVPRLAWEKKLTIESYRWPASIHLTSPGYLTETAPKLGGSIGNIHFANNNMALPSFESSLLEGRHAANKILKDLDSTENR